MHEAVLDESRQLREHVTTLSAAVLTRNGLGGLDRPASCKDSQAPEHPLFITGQQVMAPLERSAQALLSLGQITGAVGQQRQALLDALQQRLRRYQDDPRRRQLNRQPQSIESPADLSYRR